MIGLVGPMTQNEVIIISNKTFAADVLHTFDILKITAKGKIFASNPKISQRME